MNGARFREEPVGAALAAIPAIAAKAAPTIERAPRQFARGFSLIELVVVILITGIIASVVGIFITGPMLGFIDQSRRAGIVDAAELALLRMSRDVRSALPNSVRVSGGSPSTALELLGTLDGDRYRSEPPGNAAERLNIGSPDGSFNTFAVLSATGTFNNAYLAVYPLSQTGANPYVSADRVMTGPSTITVASVAGPGGSDTEYRVTLAPSFRFSLDSPDHRIYLVQGPVSYVCSGGQLLRYTGYAVQAAQPSAAALAADPSAVSAIITGSVSYCDFRYLTATTQRNGLATLSLNLSASGETVQLVRQVHVDNTP